jgi:hypothetical protein
MEDAVARIESIPAIFGRLGACLRFNGQADAYLAKKILTYSRVSEQSSVAPTVFCNRH